jgi:signal transduction histidine kinase
MEYTFTIVSWILFSTFAISGIIAVYSHVKGHSDHQIYFTMMMIMIAEWALMSTLESASLEITSKVFWSKLEYIGALSTPVFFLRYALGVAEIRKKWAHQLFWVFWLIPITIILLAATNEFHSLIWQSFSWSNAGNNILVYHHGPAFTIATVYSLALVAFAQVFIVKSLSYLPSIFKRQALSVVIACIFPFISALIYLTGNTPVEGLNITIISFLISGFVLLFGIMYLKIFDITPVARQKLTEILNDGIIILDPQNRIIYQNPAAYRYLEIQSETYYADISESKWLYSVCKDYLPNDNADKELLAQGPDDSWFNVSLIRIKDEGNSFSGNMIVLRDITLRKKLEIQTSRLNDELTNSHKQLLDLNVQKDKMLSIIGHDLKTPFHQITSLSQILKENLEELDTETKEELINDILNASENGFKILEELLNWAKAQRETGTLRPEKIHVNELVETVISGLKVSADSKKVNITTNFPDNAEVYADKNTVNIALRNIINNAIKFSFSGGNIYIEYKRHDDFAALSIRDEGVGMSENEVKKLFLSSVSTSTTGTAGESGTGLGLLLSRELLIKNKGKLEVESQQGVGSVFKIILPVNKS